MKKFSNIDKKIAFLSECASLYEMNGTSPITDDEYDNLYAEAKKEDPTNPFFSEVGGKIDDEHIYGTKVTHKYIMGSLNKDPDTKSFRKYLENTYGNDIDKLVIILELKVDGSSFCLKYQDGKFIQGVTRGDGITGLDFSNNAKFFRGFKDKISTKGYVEIKGEVYKNKQDFYNQKWSETYANSRNFTAGAINQKDPSITKERGLDFIAYEVRGIDFKTETDKQKFLVDNGFNSLGKYTTKIVCKGLSLDEIVDKIQKFMDNVDRNNLPFDVDGIVFKNNDIEWAESMGTTDGGKRPKSSRAIKFPTDKKETVLEGIEWSIGRIGTLTPVGLLKPVQLAGTTVSRVTLHNLKEMQRLGIDKTGCTVEVAKQGDIIPKVLRMTKKGDKNIIVPDNCPACDTELEWDNTNTTKVCTNEACPAQLNKRIEHFFKTIDVLGIGPGIIERLTANNGGFSVKSVIDMYSLSNHKDELAEMFGDKASENILNSINSVTEMPLAVFIRALGIGKIGSMSKDIVGIAPTVEDIDKLTVQDIIKLQGFQNKKAESFVNGWKKQRSEITRLLKYIKIKENKTMSNKLNGKSFCITGTLSRPRNDFTKVIEDNGGRFASGVSKNLDFLICGEDCGSKKDKAEKLGVKIISEEQFNKMIG